MLYIPPTQNPFLMQSFNMLGQIGQMYFAHTLRQDELKQQQQSSAQEKNKELNTKMVIAGYKPVSAENQMADVGNGPPPENQLTMPGFGDQPPTTWTKPRAKIPQLLKLDLGDGKTLPVLFEPETGKAEYIKEAVKDPAIQYFIKQDTMGLPPGQQVVKPGPKDQPAPEGWVPYNATASNPNITFIGTTANGAPVSQNTKTGSISTGNMPEEVTNPSGDKNKGVIYPKGAERLSSEVQDRLNYFVKVNESAKEVESILDKSKDLEDSLGPISGRVRSFKSNFFSDPKWVELKNTAGQLVTLVYGLSGKQISDREETWLKRDIIPQLENPGPNFRQTLKTLNKWLERNYDIDVKSFENQGKIVGKPQQKTQPTRPPLSTFQVK